jgi:Zn-dependent peptidase ImmA (M78 family)/DNA-binding transcriptional regulator YiaG
MAMQEKNQSYPLLLDEQHVNAANPERIRCARETAGLTQVELASLLKVTARTIANYETIGAPSSQVKALARALGVLPSYFDITPSSSHIEDLTEDLVWFRSLRKSTAKQRRSAVGHGRNALLFYRWIESHFFLPKLNFDIDNGIGMSPQQGASMLRGDWGYGENPLPSMVKLSESHGIRVFSLPSVGKSVDAFSFVFNGYPYIAVDISKSTERIRFDIAHEIGHLLLHESIMTETAQNDLSERVTKTGSYEQSVGHDVEKEAHQFAANLLMPTKRIRSVVPRHAGIKEVLEAKRYFKVSAMALTRRAHEIGLLSEWEYRTLCSDLTAKGYRTAEPDGIAHEQSSIFQFIVNSNNQKGISTRTMSEETGLTAQELHDLSFGNVLSVRNGTASARSATHHNMPQLTLHTNTDI